MNQRIMISAILVCAISVVILFPGCESKTHSVKIMPSSDVFAIVNDSVKVNEYVVLDLRQRLDYVRGHLVSAMWMPVDSLPKYMHFVKEEKRPIILYDEGGVETAKASVLFSKHGITNYYVMESGFSLWMAKGYPAAIQLVINTSDKVEGIAKPITAEALLPIVENGSSEFAIIDLRTVIAYKEIHIKNALSIPYVPINEFVVKTEEQNFARNKPLIVYCDANSADIALKATDILLRNLYTNVYFLEGGLEAWYKKRYPTEGL